MALIEAIEVKPPPAGRSALIVIDTLQPARPGRKRTPQRHGQVRRAGAASSSRRFECAVAGGAPRGQGQQPRRPRQQQPARPRPTSIIEVVEDGKVRTPIVRKLRDGEPPELEPFVIDNVTLEHDAESGEAVQVGVHETDRAEDGRGRPAQGARAPRCARPAPATRPSARRSVSPSRRYRSGSSDPARGPAVNLVNPYRVG